MSIEAQKLELISKISALQDSLVLQELQLILQKKEPKQAIFKRKAGWGKGLFTYVSDDFDDFIPPGFEEYLPTEDQIVKPITQL